MQKHTHKVKHAAQEQVYVQIRINYVGINHKSDKDISYKDAAIGLSCQSPINKTKTDTHTHTQHVYKSTLKVLLLRSHLS